MEKKRNTFSGSLGFVLAAAGSAVGLGNIWRFPYLAAKDGGGLFLVIYLILALTFGYTLLVTEVSIGRKTKQSPLTAYKKLNKKWGFLGIIASLVPVIIFPYYITIGGWVVKYFLAFLTGKGTEAAQDGYFTGFIVLKIARYGSEKVGIISVICYLLGTLFTPILTYYAFWGQSLTLMIAIQLAIGQFSNLFSLVFIAIGAMTAYITSKN